MLISALTDRWLNEVTKASFDCHRRRGAKSLQNNAAPFCGIDQPVQMRLRQITLRFQIDLHVRVLKPNRHTFTCHQRPTDVRTKTNLHFKVAQLYLLEVRNYADGRIKTACQRRSQEFTGTRKIAFASNGLVNRNGNIHRYGFAANDMPMDWVISGNLSINCSCMITHPRSIRHVMVVLAQWQLPVKNIGRPPFCE